jgi:hypothetical protein
LDCSKLIFGSILDTDWSRSSIFVVIVEPLSRSPSSIAIVDTSTTVWPPASIDPWRLIKNYRAGQPVETACVHSAPLIS